jgi:hypothetical protein
MSSLPIRKAKTPRTVTPDGHQPARPGLVDLREELDGYGQEVCWLCSDSPAVVRVRWQEKVNADGGSPGRREAYYFCGAHKRDAEKMLATLGFRS